MKIRLSKITGAMWTQIFTLKLPLRIITSQVISVPRRGSFNYIIKQMPSNKRNTRWKSAWSITNVRQQQDSLARVDMVKVTLLFSRRDLRRVPRRQTPCAVLLITAEKHKCTSEWSVTVCATPLSDERRSQKMCNIGLSVLSQGCSLRSIVATSPILHTLPSRI
jgi:hypothetical protein